MRSVHRNGPTGRRSSGSPPCRAWSESSKSPSPTRAARGLFPTARFWSRHSASTDLTTTRKSARKRIETRLLVRQQGEWTGYSYRWNAGQTDAELGSRRRQRRDIRGARSGRCRAAVASKTGDSPPAPNVSSATRERPASSRASRHSSSIATAITAAPSITNCARSSTSACSRASCRPPRRDDQPRLVNPYETRAPLEARVKSYLHVNCSTCHVTEGGGNCTMELGLATPPAKCG